MLGSFDISGREELSIAARVAKKAYATAGIGPQDIQVAEVHDAVAPIEMYLYEELGFCGPGESGRMMDERATWLGRLPVEHFGRPDSQRSSRWRYRACSSSGNHMADEGRGRNRQIKPAPNVGMTENGGGNMAGETAVVAINILKGE